MTLVAIPDGCDVTGGGLDGDGWTTWLGRNNSGLKQYRNSWHKISTTQIQLKLRIHTFTSFRPQNRT
jgi:hypothetical protein